jgi:FAD/FMN-containing dehydrogenase
VAAGIGAAFLPTTGFSREIHASSDIVAVTGDGEETVLSRAAVNELAESLSGTLLLPESGEYESARRIWNGMIDRRPAAIAACAGTADVAAAVTFAREHELLLAVKGGGHSFPGKSVCDGGLMIDLGAMHTVHIDVERHTAHVGGGALLGDLDSASFGHKLATTTGIVSHTGVGGFTLGGGLGRINRKFGLAIDNLLAAELVTADGRILEVNVEQHPDLFWAIRGGGGNFGVVTRFDYRLHPFDPTVLGGDITYPFAQAKDLLTFFADYSSDLPDEANVEPYAIVGEDGDRLIGVAVTYAGNHRQGEKILSPLRAFGQPLEDRIGPLSYQQQQTRADGYYAHGTLNYLKSGFLSELTPAAIDAIVDSFEGDWLPDIWFQHLGGAVARIEPAGTAYFHRKAHSNLGISAAWKDPAQSEQRIGAIRRIYAAIEPHMQGFYTNLHEDSERRTWGNYVENYPRLVAVKNRYDPGNLFRLNANVRPDEERRKVAAWQQT